MLTQHLYSITWLQNNNKEGVKAQENKGRPIFKARIKRLFYGPFWDRIAFHMARNVILDHSHKLPERLICAHHQRFSELIGPSLAGKLYAPADQHFATLTG